MQIKVWYSEWQMACCGTPFAVNDKIEWGISHGGHDEVLEDIFDETTAAQCFGSEEHHGDTDETIRGTVKAIAVVRAQYEPDPDNPRMLFAARGTGAMDPAQHVDGTEGNRGDHQLVGYLIDIAIDPNG
ncbi:DUF6578 domain-containing protein [Myceligenerans pegani]|uniref:Uncharacterized protein n=1 Tax=Myceligenerans pegani TaxID=2776917 RepID=A0ABR9N326_9MICO|nr:DUF6578 domain-containing protein [Myceligenerans sp. TRM 65318]MBE1878053.1 hypothetical protein [Myceligenerans sp. TRM 65318]MBE3020324.1 hypothetical protein [Myceligenerans sp. TRM 65318]